jgi:hypothetical protein
MALESSQPLAEMSTTNFPGGKGWPAHKAQNLIVICKPIASTYLSPMSLHGLYKDSFTFTFYYN